MRTLQSSIEIEIAMSENTISERWVRLAEKAQQQRVRQEQRLLRQQRQERKRAIAQAAGLCTECGTPLGKREWSRGIRWCSPLCLEVRMRRQRERYEQWLRGWDLENGYADPA